MEEEPKKKKKILLVDDDEFFLHVQRGILEREHFEIIEARRGEDALEVMRHESPDIVLLDLYMPEMDGLETMVRARAEGMIDLPIVIVSSENNEQKIRELIDAGANEFITKPIKIEELLKTVNNLTNEAHREHPRIPAVIKIRYRDLNELMPANSKDISNTGIFIRTRRPLLVGSPIELYLSPADESAGPEIKVTGEVVRAIQGDSVDPGMGIKFINLDAESVRTVSEIIEAQRARNKVDVMVIDDDGLIREMLTDSLIEAGYKVGSEKDAVEALKSLDRLRPSLILVDIMMPDMDGIEFSETIRKNAHTHDIPFIFISGKVDKETIMRARQSGATFFIAKPFDLNNVIEKVRKILPPKMENK